MKAIRRMHLRVAEETGMFTADEMLYPTNYQYLIDLLGYIAVGARSVENQEHRLVASGVPMPIGMKNPTGGSTSVMLNSIYAAQQPQTFIFRNWEVETTGNPLAHAVLRGYIGEDGLNYPNYHYEYLERLAEKYTEADFVNPAVIVDCNHDNSGKRPFEQIRIRHEVQIPCAARSKSAISSGLHGGKLPGRRQPAHRRRRVRQVHHRPMPRLGENGALGTRYRRARVAGASWADDGSRAPGVAPGVPARSRARLEGVWPGFSLDGYLSKRTPAFLSR